MRRVLFAVLTVALLLGASAAAADKKAVSDDVIYDQVRLRLTSDMLVNGGAIEVDVEEGVVTLAGKVKSEKAKDKATKLAKKVKGVRSVDNKLVIDVTSY
jgi:hyperosmotically inducible protein